MCAKLDDQWAHLKNFVRYDFNDQTTVPEEMHQTFDCVVIDPPFITREVWEKFAQVRISDYSGMFSTWNNSQFRV